MKKRFLFTVLAVGILGLRGAAQEEDPMAIEDGSGYFIFLGADLRAALGSKYFPVVAADGRGVFVESNKGVKRVGYASNCNYMPVVSLSTNYVAVEDFNQSYIHIGKSRRESQAMADVMAAGAQSEIEVSRLSDQIEENAPAGSSAEVKNEMIYDEIADVQFDQQNLEEQVRGAIEDDSFSQEGINDTVFVSMVLNPAYDIEDGYCALVVSYFKGDAYERFKGHRQTTVRIRKIGDLLGGIPNKVSVSAFIGEGNYEDAVCEFYVFSGDGKPIATSESQGLKHLTNEQLRRLQELEAKAQES